MSGTDRRNQGILSNTASKHVQNHKKATGVGVGFAKKTDLKDPTFSSTNSPITSQKPSEAKQTTSEEFREHVLESYIGKQTPNDPTKKFVSKYEKLAFAKHVANNFAKLGKNPTEQQVRGLMKTLGITFAQKRRLSFEKNQVDFTSERFKNQVMQSFVGLNPNSKPVEIEEALSRLGLLAEDKDVDDLTASISDIALLPESQFAIPTATRKL